MHGIHGGAHETRWIRMDAVAGKDAVQQQRRESHARALEIRDSRGHVGGEALRHSLRRGVAAR